MTLQRTLPGLFIPAARRLTRVHWWPVLLAILVGPLSVMTFWLYRGYVFEDAFITYRYAENLAAGHGFVFNPGEHILGTTTPLYALVLAFFKVVGLSIQPASAALFALSLGACGVFGALILRRFGSGALGLLYATLVLMGPDHLPRFVGLETPFYTALILGALWCALAARRPREERRTEEEEEDEDGLAQRLWSVGFWKSEKLRSATGLLLGLAFLTRYDGALFAVLLLPALWWRDRRLPWREALVSLATILPWLLFAQLYFGSIFPHTLAAKRETVTTAAYLYQAAAIQLRAGIWPLESVLPFRVTPIVAALVGLLLIAWPILACTRRLTQREPLSLLGLAFPVALWLGYGLIGPPVGHIWHLIPGTLVLLLHCCACWGEMGRGLFAEHGRAARWAAGGTAVAAIGLAALYPPVAVDDAALILNYSGYGARIGAYRTIATWINEHHLNELTVLMREPGFFSFVSKNPMIDGAGLITEGIQFHRSEDRTKTSDIVDHWKPDLIVTTPPRWPEPGTTDDYIPLYHAAPARSLLIRRSSLQANYAALRDAWLEKTALWPGPGEPITSPLTWELVPGHLPEGWSQSGNLRGFVGHPVNLPYRGKPMRDVYLHTLDRGTTQGNLSSPPFVIDFDALAFRFGGNGGTATRASLLVDGQEVARANGSNRLEMFDVEWPVMTWRGKVGVLQLVDEDERGKFLVANEIRSIQYRSKRLLDDFESGTYSPLWRQTFGQGPTHLSDVGSTWGLAFQVGRYGATSANLHGPLEMISRPFELAGDALSMLVLDFGGGATGVELRVGGKAVRAFHGFRSHSLVPLVWDVGPWRGQQAELVIVDGQANPSVWIGVDEIYLIER